MKNTNPKAYCFPKARPYMLTRLRYIVRIPLRVCFSADKGGLCGHCGSAVSLFVLYLKKRVQRNTTDQGRHGILRRTKHKLNAMSPLTNFLEEASNP